MIKLFMGTQIVFVTQLLFFLTQRAVQQYSIGPGTLWNDGLVQPTDFQYGHEKKGRQT
jgi:hypothetical protein